MPNILWRDWNRQPKNPVYCERVHDYIRLTTNDLERRWDSYCNFWIIEKSKFDSFIKRFFETYISYIDKWEIDSIVSQQQRSSAIEDNWILINIKHTLDQIWLNIMKNKLEETRQGTFYALAAE